MTQQSSSTQTARNHTHRRHAEWGEIQVYRINSRQHGKVFQVYLTPEFCSKVKGATVGDFADIRMIGGNFVVSTGNTPGMMNTKSLSRGLPHQAEGTVGFRLTEEEMIDRGMIRFVDKANGSHFVTVNPEFFRDSKLFTLRQTK